MSEGKGPTSAAGLVWRNAGKPPRKCREDRRMSATRFLHEAAKKTPRLAAPNGKVLDVHPLIEGEESGECRLCASETGRGFSWRGAAKKTFTDHDVCRRPESDALCEFCAWALGWAPGTAAGKGGVTTFRLYSVYATPAGVELPSRARWREILTEPPRSEYLACLAVSGKKWLHIKSRVGRPAPHWDAMLEERRVIVAPKVLRAILADFESLYAGFPKSRIEAGDYPPPLVSAFGVERFDGHERRLKVFRGSDLFRVAAFVAQKPERKEDEGCATGSRPTAKRSESRLF